MFADLNKHAVRPSDSISTLFDKRDQLSELARHVQKNVHIFSRMTEMEKSSISNRSSKLFTLSSIKNASKSFLQKGPKDVVSKEEKDLAAEYWNEVATNMNDWQQALVKNVPTYELREQYIHAHGVMLQAMGGIGADLLSSNNDSWKTVLKKLKKIDWRRIDGPWTERSMENGRISKARTKVILTGNYIKQKLGLPLNSHEEEIEKKFINE